MKKNVLFIILVISLFPQTIIFGQSFKDELDTKYERYYSKILSMDKDLTGIDSLIMIKSPLDSVKVKTLYVKALRLSQELSKENMSETIMYNKKLSMVEQMYLERTQEKAQKSVDALIFKIEKVIEQMRNRHL
jgi:Skp family chaperone for outer membrane proteins